MIDDTIKTPWNPNKPIEILSRQIEDAQIYALCGNLGYDLLSPDYVSIE